MQLKITPNVSLTDEVVLIKVTNAGPGQRVAIEAQLMDALGQKWRSYGVYRAGHNGEVDVGVDTSIDGTYEGIDPLGLFWSMIPLAFADDASVGISRETTDLMCPQLSPEQLHEVSFIAESEGLTSQRVAIRRTWVRPGTVMTEIKEGRLRGTYYEPPYGSTASMAVLVITGSDGGVSTTLAPLLASHGVPTFAVGYFAYDDLPTALADIPIEYFAEAAEWTRRRSGAEQLTAIGISYGAIAAALSTAHFKQFADRLILYVPGPLVEQGWDAARGESVSAAWTYEGRPIAYARGITKSKLDMVSVKRGPLIVPALSYTRAYREEWEQDGADRNYGIPVERIQIPVLLFSGDQDAAWPSSLGATRIAARMKSHSPAARVEHISFEEAGHMISRPGIVTSLSTVTLHDPSGTFCALGGSPRANATASLSALQRSINFIRASELNG